MNNNILKLRFQFLSQLGRIPDTTAFENKENELKEEYESLIEFEHSDELKRFYELKEFIESSEFTKRKKEINAQKFSDTEEYKQEQRFKELAKNKDIKSYFKLKDSDELNHLQQQIDSGNLDKFHELSKFFNSPDFKNFKNELEQQRKEKQKEYKDTLNRYKKLKNKYKWFYDFKESDDFAFYNTFINSDKLNEFENLKEEVANINLKDLKKRYKKGELEGNFEDSDEYSKVQRFRELKNDDEIKRFYKIAKSKKLEKYNQLKDSDEIREFERLEEYVNSPEFEKIPEEIEKLKFENTEEFNNYKEYKELKASSDIQKAKKLQESKEYESYNKIKDSDLLQEYNDLNNYLSSDDFKQFKEQMTRKNKFKHSPEYQDYVEYKELKNSDKIKWYFKRKDSEDFDFFRKWEHSFYDNFEGGKLDTSKWLTSPFWGKNLLKDSYVQTTDKHFLTNGNNLVIESNQLQILTKKEQVEGKAWHPKFGFHPKKFDYTSGMINTSESFRQKYGIFRAKVRIDDVYPFKHSFWLVSDKISPEIDIFNFFDKSPRKVQFNNFWGNFSKNEKVQYDKKTVKGPDFTKDFYIFSLEWEENLLTWKINGVPVKQQKIGIPDIQLYMILNSGLQEDTNDHQLPSKMIIDWVEVYQKK